MKTKELSKQVRDKVVEKYRSGLGYKKVSETLNIRRSTFKSIIKKCREYGITTNLPTEDRPQKLTDQARRALIREATKRPKIILKELQSSTAGVSASARTVRRRLLEDGLVSRRAAKKPLLSRKNIRDRLIFCKRYRDWTAEDWGKVIFSDESPFRLFGASGKKLLGRTPVYM
uniref:Uncharacterized protein n=1 Tax=Salmo trutta TaxID=8032 RepID=A0A673W276_SALTR